MEALLRSLVAAALALTFLLCGNLSAQRRLAAKSVHEYVQARRAGAENFVREKDARADSARVARWHEDLALLSKGLAEKAKPLQDDAAKKRRFLDALAELDKDVPRKTDEEIVVGIMKALALVGDGHTQLNFARFGWHEYPVRLYWFAEGVYVTEAASGYERLLGARLLRVGDASVEHLLKQLSTMIPHENESAFKAFAPTFLTSADVLKGMDAVRDTGEARFVFRGRDGKKTEAALRPVADKVKWVSYPAKQLRYARPDENYWFQYLADSGTMYFQYQHCDEMEKLPFTQFQRQLLDALDANPVKRLVIDLRDNGGGRSSILDPFIETLAKRNATDRALPTYVLIGRGTFSSAGLNAIGLKLKAHATFVGEPSGVKPNHYGELKTLELPNSRLRVFYSTQYWRSWPSDADASLMPDVSVKESWKDYTAGTDAALSAITTSSARLERAGN
jgi:hypothetical protein